MNSPKATGLEFRLEGAEQVFSVAEFQVAQHLSRPFEVVLLLRAAADFDIEGTVGRLGRFEAPLPRRDPEAPESALRFAGFVVAVEDAGGDAAGHRLFRVVLASRLWALSQNRTYRVFQQMSEVQIACKIFDEWKIRHRLAIDPARYRPLPYRVQYAESDLAFVHRNLESVGISYAIVNVEGEHVVVLMDEPQARTPRKALTFLDPPPNEARVEFASEVGLTRRARAGRYVVQDLDYRRMNQQLRPSAHAESSSIEGQIERYHFTPGSSHRIVEGAGAETPAADDKGATRSDERFGEFLAKLRLEAKQADRWQVDFASNALDLHPGVVVPIAGHDRTELAGPVLVIRTFLVGSDVDPWSIDCGGVLAAHPFRPPTSSTPWPHAGGLESATVVGPSGTEIHTDEFGRVRVQFHWDREGQRDAGSSCWVPVSQALAGAGFGSVHLPRVGQEVLVDFLGGDLDKPVVIGRVYTQQQPAPYKLPEHKTKTVICRTQTVDGPGYNEIVAEDAAGRQVLGFHAERDLETTVKNDLTENVGHRWRFDALAPGAASPGGARSGLDWEHERLDVEIGQARVIATHDSITLRVGDATSIVLTPGKVAIQADVVDINGQTLVDVHGGTIQLNC